MLGRFCIGTILKWDDIDKCGGAILIDVGGNIDKCGGRY